MHKKDLVFWIWVAVAILAILNILYFDLKIITAPDTVRVQYIPDDAFYYLGLARNFVHFHSWTFDAGVSNTTGFHLLYAYLLAAIYGLFHPSTSAFLISALALCSGATLLACVYALWLGIRQRNTFFILALAVIASSANFITNSISGVEWPLVVLIAALFCGTLYMGFSSRRTAIALFFLGLLGSLARSDFAMLPGAFFCAAVFVWFYNKDRAPLRSVAWGLAGAVLGILVVFIHNYLFSGSWLQSSAIVKLHWAKYAHADILFIVSLAASLVGRLLVGGLRQALYAACFLPLSVAVALEIIKRRKSRPLRVGPAILPPRETTFVIAAVIAWYGYIIFYSGNGAVMRWYTAGFVLPTFILMAGLGQYLTGKLFKTPEPVLWLFLLPTLFIFVAGYQSLYPFRTDTSLWPHQQFTLEAGKYLHDHPVDGKLAAWNAGIVGYYQGGNVINIDGLVNNDVYPYILSNSLPVYLDSRNITYLIDSQSMLDEAFRLRGGYDDPAFIQRLVPIKTFDQGGFDWQPLTLYRIQK